jgi:hypothetical protein
MFVSTWLDPEAEEIACQDCYHFEDEHIPVRGDDGTVTYPCGAEEKYDVDSNGRMVLTDEPCVCEGFRN